MKTIEEKIDNRIENLIIEHKDMKNCSEAIRTFVENLVDELPGGKRTIEVNNEKFKANSNKKSALKAILYDKYSPNRAKIVTKSSNEIKTYSVSISYKQGYKIFYVKYNRKWIRLRDIIEKLLTEGLVRFRNIIRILRTRNNKRHRAEDKIAKTDEIDQ